MSKAGILIVEDSYIVAFHLQKTLESEGYVVIGTQTSGEGAIAALEKKVPDLVLMDIMLEGDMDGIQTAGIIQEKYHIPVIYITALTDRDTIQRAKITEPFGYLTKPFEDREIFTVIEMALYKHEVESKLRRSEQRYFSTVKSISDATIIFDNEYLITYINPSAEMLTGIRLSEAQKMTIFDVVVLRDPITLETLINPVQCAFNAERPNSMREGLVLVSKDQKEIPIGEGSVNPIFDYKNQLMGLIMIFKDLTDKVARENLQKDIEKQKLNAMIEGQENERSRIAKDLHDGLGQMLNAIKMNVKMVIQEGADTKTLYGSIDEAIQETIRISENLLPAKLRDFDLVTCLKSLCNQLNKSSSREVSFESFGFDMDMTHSQKINFYRIAQEALNNAIKHSDARSITVQLSHQEENIELSIEDDGRGMDFSGNRNGSYESMKHGLANMRDRAEIMGGKLNVESDKNRGTLVILEVPTKIVISDAKV